MGLNVLFMAFDLNKFPGRFAFGQNFRFEILKIFRVWRKQDRMRLSSLDESKGFSDAGKNLQSHW